MSIFQERYIIKYSKAFCFHFLQISKAISKNIFHLSKAISSLLNNVECLMLNIECGMRKRIKTMIFHSKFTIYHFFKAAIYMEEISS